MAMIYLATHEIVTSSADTPASQPFKATLRKTFSVTRSLKGGSSGYGGLQMSIGDIEAENGEADYDTIETDYLVDGEEVTIKVGAAPALGSSIVDYSGFHTVGVFVAKSKSADEETFRVKLMDKSFRLDVPAQPEVYGGTGNLDGGPEVSGKRKPWAMGYVLGITPAPVIPVELVYQVSWRSVQAITAVYDTGVPLTATADYATSGLLRAVTTLIPGQYATCIAECVFMLGGTPFGPLTADVEGDNGGLPTAGVGFLSSTGGIVKLLAQVGADIATAEIAANTFNLLDLQQGSEIGYFLGHESNETVAQTIVKLMDAIGGYAGFSRLGKFEVGLIDAPSIVPTLRYVTQDVINIERQPVPDVLDPPPWRQRAIYQRNWTTLTQVAGEEDDSERVAYLQSPGKIATTLPTAGGAPILVDHPDALDPDPIESYFRDEDDAIAEATRRLVLYGTTRTEVVVELGTRPFVHDVNETIEVTRPRFDMGSGKRLRIVSIEDRMGPDGDTQIITGLT